MSRTKWPFPVTHTLSALGIALLLILAGADPARGIGMDKGGGADYANQFRCQNFQLVKAGGTPGVEFQIDLQGRCALYKQHVSKTESGEWGYGSWEMAGNWIQVIIRGSYNYATKAAVEKFSLPVGDMPPVLIEIQMQCQKNPWAYVMECPGSVIAKKLDMSGWIKGKEPFFPGPYPWSGWLDQATKNSLVAWESGQTGLPDLGIQDQPPAIKSPGQGQVHTGDIVRLWLEQHPLANLFDVQWEYQAEAPMLGGGTVQLWRPASGIVDQLDNDVYYWGRQIPRSKFDPPGRWRVRVKVNWAPLSWSEWREFYVGMPELHYEAAAAASSKKAGGEGQFQLHPALLKATRDLDALAQRLGALPHSPETQLLLRDLHALQRDLGAGREPGEAERLIRDAQRLGREVDRLEADLQRQQQRAGGPAPVEPAAKVVGPAEGPQLAQPSKLPKVAAIPGAPARDPVAEEAAKELEALAKRLTAMGANPEAQRFLREVQALQRQLGSDPGQAPALLRDAKRLTGEVDRLEASLRRPPTTPPGIGPQAPIKRLQ